MNYLWSETITMRGEIHPLFEPLDDKIAAEAFSEQILHGDLFKVATLDVDEDVLGNQGFPPVPAYPLGLVHAYIEGDTGVRRQAVINPVGRPLDRDFSSAFVSSYEKHVTAFHKIADAQAQDPAFQLDSLAEYTIAKTRQAGLRTVAAFALMQSPDTKQYFGGLQIPRAIYQDLPLANREGIVNLMGAIQRQGIDLLQELPEESRKTIQRALQGDPSDNNMAFFAGALTLPRVEAVKPQVDAHTPAADPHAGLSRTERRKLQAKDRRAHRRNPNTNN